ncbi:MAG: hypothetical protein CMB82_05120 [Flammeovirgaceae bacterium]|nr:hypothetical protein [Flammeovirgaceae bacterium]|tara:strand:+ start:191 stop:715 length:525 start_codon:yes stop_codon:yes gene_type:complete
MKFTEIATLSGKGGLFKVINPTRTGFILEALDGSKKRMIVGASVKVSVLSEISIYVLQEVESVPLLEVFKIIHKNYAGEIGLDKKSDHDELKSFFKSVLPYYDVNRVYVSDIKKVITWYQSLLNLGLGNLIEGDNPETKKEMKVKPEVDDVVQRSAAKNKNKKGSNSTKKVDKS